MTTRRDFLSGLAVAGLGGKAIFRENAIGSMLRANLIAGDRAPDSMADD